MLKAAKVHAVSNPWGCVCVKPNKMHSLHHPGIAQSHACQKHPNWLLGLSFTASLHLATKTQTLICRRGKRDINFTVQELKGEEQNISQGRQDHRLSRQSFRKNSSPWLRCLRDNNSSYMGCTPRKLLTNVLKKMRFYAAQCHA